MHLIWLILAIAILDQIIKQVVRIQMVLFQEIPVFGDVIRLKYIENPGMAFGIDPGNKLIFTLLTIAIVIGLIYYFFQIRQESLYQRVPVALILGGAIGNLIDRIFYGVWFQLDGWFHGRVVDYIDVDIPDIDFLGIYMSRWPIFNLADMAVSVGVILMIIFMNKGLKTDEPDGTNPGSDRSPDPAS